MNTFVRVLASLGAALVVLALWTLVWPKSGHRELYLWMVLTAAIAVWMTWYGTERKAD